MLLNILIPLIGIVVDQIVKYWAATDLQACGTIPLWEGVFHLTYCENTGAAFSMFSGLRLIISGAIGNMIDRFLLGYVVDLFDFRLINFPIFNVADILLCVGVGMMVLYILFMEPKIEKAKKEAAQDGDHLSDGNA